LRLDSVVDFGVGVSAIVATSSTRRFLVARSIVGSVSIVVRRRATESTERSIVVRRLSFVVDCEFPSSIVSFRRPDDDEPIDDSTTITIIDRSTSRSRRSNRSIVVRRVVQIAPFRVRRSRSLRRRFASRARRRIDSERDSTRSRFRFVVDFRSSNRRFVRRRSDVRAFRRFVDAVGRRIDARVGRFRSNRRAFRRANRRERRPFVRIRSFRRRSSSSVDFRFGGPFVVVETRRSSSFRLFDRSSFVPRKSTSRSGSQNDLSSRPFGRRKSIGRRRRRNRSRRFVSRFRIEDPIRASSFRVTSRRSVVAVASSIRSVARRIRASIDRNSFRSFAFVPTSFAIAASFDVGDRLVETIDSIDRRRSPFGGRVRFVERRRARRDERRETRESRRETSKRPDRTGVDDRTRSSKIGRCVVERRRRDDFAISRSIPKFDRRRRDVVRRRRFRRTEDSIYFVVDRRRPKSRRSRRRFRRRHGRDSFASDSSTRRGGSRSFVRSNSFGEIRIEIRESSNGFIRRSSVAFSFVVANSSCANDRTIASIFDSNESIVRLRRRFDSRDRSRSIVGRRFYESSSRRSRVRLGASIRSIASIVASIDSRSTKRKREKRTSFDGRSTNLRTFVVDAVRSSRFVRIDAERFATIAFRVRSRVDANQRFAGDASREIRRSKSRSIVDRRSVSISISILRRRSARSRRGRSSSPDVRSAFRVRESHRSSRRVDSGASSAFVRSVSIRSRAVSSFLESIVFGAIDASSFRERIDRRSFRIEHTKIVASFPVARRIDERRRASESGFVVDFAPIVARTNRRSGRPSLIERRRLASFSTPIVVRRVGRESSASSFATRVDRSDDFDRFRGVSIVARFREDDRSIFAFDLRRRSRIVRFGSVAIRISIDRSSIETRRRRRRIVRRSLDSTSTPPSISVRPSFRPIVSRSSIRSFDEFRVSSTRVRRRRRDERSSSSDRLAGVSIESIAFEIVA